MKTLLLISLAASFFACKKVAQDQSQQKEVVGQATVKQSGFFGLLNFSGTIKFIVRQYDGYDPFARDKGPQSALMVMYQINSRERGFLVLDLKNVSPRDFSEKQWRDWRSTQKLIKDRSRTTYHVSVKNGNPELDKMGERGRIIQESLDLIFRKYKNHARNLREKDDEKLVAAAALLFGAAPGEQTKPDFR